MAIRTKRFDFNWKPLQMQISLVEDKGVPGQQNYNADTQEYTPDYTITPFILQPHVSIIDRDGILENGRINNQLANVNWWEIVDGVETKIEDSNKGYEITRSGFNAGRIKVKKNSKPKSPITLRFRAEYADQRNGQVLVVQAHYLIQCKNASEAIRVELDASAQSAYNPLEDERERSVKATVYVGESVCDSNNYSLVWEVMGEDTTWHVVGSDSVLDYDVTINGSVATVNRWLMGEELHLRCRIKYSAEGNPESVTLTEGSPQAVVVFVRTIPKYEFDFTGVPYNIPPGIINIAPRAVVSSTKGNIVKPEMELLPLWYVATNKATGSLSYSLVGHGMSVVVPTKVLSQSYGAVIGLDVVDRGPVCALCENSDGSVYCDADGSVLIIH